MECLGLAVTFPDGRTVLALGENEADLFDALLRILDEALVHDFECATNPGRRGHRPGALCDCSLLKRLH